jgi:hypothetical protein
MTDPAGLYVARADGFWWSGDHQGPAWVAVPDGTYDPETFSYGPDGTYWPTPGVSVGLTDAVLADTPYTPSTLPVENGTNGVFTIDSGGNYDCIDFHCKVRVTTSDVVIITRSRVRGNAIQASNAGLVDLGGTPYGFKNVFIYDCDLIPDYPSVWWNGGLMNHDYTAVRCRVERTVDGFGIYGKPNTSSGFDANVVLEGCYTDKLAYFSPDPNHKSPSADADASKTHNDGGFQWQGGGNVTARYCNFAGYLDPTVGEANYSSAAPRNDGLQGGPNGVTSIAGFNSGFNINYSDLAQYGKFLIDGADVQISSTNGGECANLDMHHCLLSGANRAFTISQAYAALGKIHDCTFTADYRANVACNVLSTMIGGQGSGKSLEWWNNLDLNGNPVPIYLTDTGAVVTHP